jgi:ABC-type multidrug transport system ATPase subunit
MQEAEDLCNRIAILRKGKLLICESIENIKALFNNNGRYVIKLKENCHNLHQKIQSHVIGAKIVDIHSEVSFNNGSMVTLEIDAQSDNISEIINHIITSGISVEAFGPKKSPLDEIFAKIVA